MIARFKVELIAYFNTGQEFWIRLKSITRRAGRHISQPPRLRQPRIDNAEVVVQPYDRNREGHEQHVDGAINPAAAVPDEQKGLGGGKRPPEQPRAQTTRDR